MMTKERKAQEIASISASFGKAKAAFLVDPKGLNVEQVTKLRKTLFAIKAEMKVVRNTLAIRAIQEHPTMTSLNDSLVGTNAIVFAFDDVSAPAKALSEFQKDIETLQIKTGVMDGRAMDENQIKYLATLPGKDQLRAKLLGVLQAPMSKMLGTMQAVPGGFARVLNAYKEQKEKAG